MPTTSKQPLITRDQLKHALIALAIGVLVQLITDAAALLVDWLKGIEQVTGPAAATATYVTKAIHRNWV